MNKVRERLRPLPFAIRQLDVRCWELRTGRDVSCRQQAAIMTHSDHINRSVICQTKQSQSVGDAYRREARQP